MKGPPKFSLLSSCFRKKNTGRAIPVASQRAAAQRTTISISAVPLSEVLLQQLC
jgi:hypothetical protein